MSALVILLPFLAALTVTLLLTPLLRSIAPRLRMVAAPAADRWHERSTPLLGGVGIYAGFVTGGVITLLVRAQASGGAAAGGTAGAGISRPWIGVFLAATIMFVVGLVDDRLKLNPPTKLMLQAAAAATLVSFGVIYPLTPWVVGNVLITFFWFIALTNAMNLLDHMDGVAVGVAGIAAVFLGTTLFLDDAYTIAAATFGLAGACFGFLRYNFPRASIFMGDAGSMFLGALLAGLGAAYPSRVPSASLLAVLFVPAMIVIIPIIDTLLVTATRTLAGRPVSAGGKDHTSHKLVAMGFSERQVPLVLYSVAAAGGLMALVLRSQPRLVGFVTGAIFLTGVLLGLAYLARLQPYERSEGRPGRVTLLVADLVHKRRALEVLMDVVLFALAYQAAYLLRWDGRLPDEQAAVFATTLGVAVAAKSVSFAIFGVYRGFWQYLTLSDAQRIAKAALFGTLLTTAALVFFFREQFFGRGILIIDGLLVAVFAIAARASFRSLDLFRSTLRRDGAATLIYGAGVGGGIALRELSTNTRMALRPVGFIDDDSAKRSRLMHGYPVLGSCRDIPEIVRRHGIRTVVVTPKTMRPDVRRDLELMARENQFEILDLHVEFRRHELTHADHPGPRLVQNA